jgi:prevent-host-death family protein
MPSQTVSIDEARNQLSELITTASEGGEVLIVENGKALARIIPAGDSAIYRFYAPTAIEFSTDEESLAWESDGWENLA